MARGTPTPATVWKSSQISRRTHHGLWREAASAGSVKPKSLSSPGLGAPHLQPYRVRRLHTPLPPSALNVWTDPAWFAQNYRLLTNQSSINQQCPDTAHFRSLRNMKQSLYYWLTRNNDIPTDKHSGIRSCKSICYSYCISLPKLILFLYFFIYCSS